MILNFIIIAGAASSNIIQSIEKRDAIVSTILGVILNFKIFDLPLKIYAANGEAKNLEEDTSKMALISVNSDVKSISLEETKTNIILTSNALRLCASCLCFVGPNCQKYFSRVMCPLLEKAGDPNLLVASSASLALRELSNNCLYGNNVNLLIQETVPHFWYNLSQQLKHLPDYPCAPQVLRFVLRQSENEVSEFVDDLVDDVLDSLDSFHDDSALPLLGVLLAFADSLLHSLKTKREVNEKPNKVAQIPNVKKMDSGLLEFLINLHNENKEEDISETQIEQEIDMETMKEDFEKLYNKEEDDKIEITDDEINKPEVPKRIKIVVTIMERCSYLLFYKDRKIQLLLLQIIECGCQLLNDYEDEKLPVFHKLWKPLVLRLKDKDFVVLLYALQVCTLMVNLSGDFLRRRCLKELFPSLCFFLESQHSSSFNLTKNHSYYYTPAYKAQLQSLKQLPDLIRGLDFKTLESIDLLSVLVLYLDSRQPQIFIDFTFQSLGVLYAKYPDLVWFMLSLCKERQFISPLIPGLQDIKVHFRHSWVISN